MKSKEFGLANKTNGEYTYAIDRSIENNPETLKVSDLNKTVDKTAIKELWERPKKT